MTVSEPKAAGLRQRWLLEARPDGKPLLRGWLHGCALAAALVAGPLLVARAEDNPCP